MSAKGTIEEREGGRFRPPGRGLDVALVVHDFDPGLGQGRYCVELARRLVPRHRVTVYANRFGVEAEAGWDYVRVPAIRMSAVSTILTFLAAAESRVGRGRGRGRHDVVHAQGLTCWGADVITAHVCNEARYRVSPPGRWRSRLFPAVIHPVEALFYRQRRARQLIAISKRVAAEIRDCYRWNRPVTVIHHGVDAGRFRPVTDALERRQSRERYGVGEEAWVWLFVGEAVKGLQKAVEQLPAFPRARLLAVTRSDPGPYRARAAELGVADRVLFPGPDREVWQAYRAADVFVYPSAYDTFGMVVLEAMASGLPVVVGQDIGAAEIVEDGVNGFLVDPAQPRELGGVLARLEAFPNAARALGCQARRTAEGQSWEGCARATESVYLATRLRSALSA